MRRIIYFSPKRKKRAKKRLKRGPFNLVQYHQFPFLYEETDDEEFADLDEESSYFSSSKLKKTSQSNRLNDISHRVASLHKKRAKTSSIPRAKV